AKSSIQKQISKARETLKRDAASVVMDGPTPERFAKGAFTRVVPPARDKTSARRVYRDMHADAVLRMRADEVIGDIELAAAIRFAELARRAMGPVRLASSGMHDRVDGSVVDDDAQAARDIHARKEWAAVKATLRRQEYRVLVEILYFENNLSQAGMKMFGERWRGVHARNAAVSALVETGLEGLVRLWGLKIGA
ncbi:MAG: hypothetical protein Q9M33_13070, partial [Robiginitomaculum sp.]|nr:hypothetical protein [Robiginitomaculum sp.]